jgi:hypothetical protein
MIRATESINTGQAACQAGMHQNIREKRQWPTAAKLGERRLETSLKHSDD